MTQWYLCKIYKSPSDDQDSLKKTDNLSVRYPDVFFGDGWYVWLPIIPRVGDTLQFDGSQVQVSNVILETDWTTKTGIKEDAFVSARITIRENIVPKSTDAYFSIDGKLQKNRRTCWEDYARRGHDLEYYAWELRHPSYVVERGGKMEGNYRWHTRIRPVAGDFISVDEKRWKVTSVELASANASVDGWLTLESAQ